MNNEDLPLNLDEFFAEPTIFSMQDLVHYPPLPPTPTDPGPINTHFPSNMFNFSSFDQSLNDPPLPPHPQHQRKLEKGDSSTRPHPPPLRLIRDNTPIISKAFPSCISTQDESSKDDSEDYEDHHQQQPPPLTSREAHNVCQKRRRDRVKEKINTLKDLIPNCDKNDMASVLDEAIKYIKSLKLQAQYYGWYQQQVHARAWGGGQIPVVSPVANSILRAPPYLQHDLHQQQMILPYHPMILMQPSHEQLTRSLPPIPKKSVTSSTSTSAAEIDNREVEKSLP